MNQPKDAFNQVKSILGKLDRSITEARSRRLGEDSDDETTIDDTSTVSNAADEPSTDSSPSNGATPAAPAAGYARLRGQFGRAKAVKPGVDVPNP